VTRPTVSQAEAWQPDSLRRLADSWDEAARRVIAHVDSVMREVGRSNEFWTGATADAARDNARGIAAACWRGWHRAPGFGELDRDSAGLTAAFMPPAQASAQKNAAALFANAAALVTSNYSAATALSRTGNFQSGLGKWQV